MASTTIYLTNGLEIKKAPVGYSWTVCIFGGWPCLFRQDWLWAIILLIAEYLTWGIAGIIFGFFYNKIYIKGLIGKGYKIKDMPGISESELKSYLGYIELPMA